MSSWDQGVGPRPHSLLRACGLSSGSSTGFQAGPSCVAFSGLMRALSSSACNGGGGRGGERVEGQRWPQGGGAGQRAHQARGLARIPPVHARGCPRTVPGKGPAEERRASRLRKRERQGMPTRPRAACCRAGPAAALAAGRERGPRAAPYLVHVAVPAAQRRVELVVGVGKRVDQGQGVGPHRAHQAALSLAQPPGLAACGGGPPGRQEGQATSGGRAGPSAAPRCRAARGRGASSGGMACLRPGAERPASPPPPQHTRGVAALQQVARGL